MDGAQVASRISELSLDGAHTPWLVLKLSGWFNDCTVCDIIDSDALALGHTHSLRQKDALGRAAIPVSVEELNHVFQMHNITGKRITQVIKTKRILGIHLVTFTDHAFGILHGKAERLQDNRLSWPSDPRNPFRKIGKGKIGHHLDFIFVQLFALLKNGADA